MSPVLAPCLPPGPTRPRARRAGFCILVWLWLTGAALLSGCSSSIDLDSFRLTPVPTSTTTPGPVYYTVQPGDTLWAIAERVGIDPAILARVNELEDPDLLQIGQELLISDRVTISGEVLPTATPTPLPCLDGCPRPPPGCQIKGIIARLDGTRMYLLPDDEPYPRLEADIWFCREEDAVRSGWVRWTVYGPSER